MRRAMRRTVARDEPGVLPATIHRCAACASAPASMTVALRNTVEPAPVAILPARPEPAYRLNQIAFLIIHPSLRASSSRAGSSRAFRPSTPT